MSEDNIVFNILLLGNQAVGKTSFILRFCEDTFNDLQLSSSGIDIKYKDIKRRDRDIKLKIFDTAGQERFKSISKSYFKKADGILLLYDVSNKDSFDSIISWVESIEECLDLSEIGILIVGNKCEIPDEEKVVNNEMKEKLENNLKVKVKVMEASARDNKNVEECYMYLVDKMLEIKLGLKLDNNSKNTLKLDKKTHRKVKQKHHCCSEKKKNVNKDK